ncbi:MAG: trypsin-like peptidase domain-containing protein [Saprospiraceae bacterium]
MQALELYTNTIRELIGEGEIEQAIETLTKLNDSVQLDMDNTLLNLRGQYKRLQRDVDEGYLDRRDARIDQNRIQRAITNLLDDVPRKLELRGKINGITGYNFGIEKNDTFEKIIGSQDNLLKISWLEKALSAAKSVCLIVGADGSRGTGFMIADNYLVTNNHVIPDVAFAKTAYIEFNFEENRAGSQKERYRYELDATDFLTSDKYELDVTRVRVKENTNAQPLSHWGYLNLESKSKIRTGDPVTIIQHAAGEQKRIALNANEVIGTENQYLFYKTDTLAGSSGSPVFNRDWDVVALHHAGSNFKNTPANRGILIEAIVDFFANQPVKIEQTQDDAVAEKATTPPPPKSTFSTIFASEQRTNLFLLYDQGDDLAAAKELKKHLSPLRYITKEVDVFDIHHDDRLGYGDSQATINQAMGEADFVIAMISPSFFVENYAMAEQARDLGKTIIPILVRKTDFYEPSFLGKFRSLPTDGRFISEWANEDDAYTNIAQQIRLLHQKR